MTITEAGIALRCVEILVWPAVLLLLVFIYRKEIRSLLAGARIAHLTLAGVRIELPVRKLEASIGEALEAEVSAVQWNMLSEMHKVPGLFKFRENLSAQRELDDTIDTDDMIYVRPLRNAGLIKHPLSKYLFNAEDIELTHLGRAYIEARKEAEATS